jgi:hypothetical protein
VTDIQKGDRRALRHALIVVVVSVVIGMIALGVIARHRTGIEDWIEDDPSGRLRTLALLGALGMLPFAAAGTWIFRLGRRIVRAERFPPPGTTVFRDTVVLRGRAARRRGLLIEALAVFLLSAAATGIATLLWLVAG